ncbi:hypothetical protein BM524_08345 [Alteromonas mediterranea]|uniref:Uncharacterized protein n=1 Tax=Alteromonas mediterranea TaxID=314275 RepID=A0AAC9NR62_9ALTE|nr:hypothetical protein BM524_08345 [Alteromonas mediterranea]
MASHYFSVSVQFNAKSAKHCYCQHYQILVNVLPPYTLKRRNITRVVWCEKITREVWCEKSCD